VEPELISNKICIVGGAAGRERSIQYKNTDWNIWCVARIYNSLSYASLVFEMHQSSNHWFSGTSTAHKDKKLILQKETKSLPFAFVLPTENILNEFGNVFTSSFSWMVAYAVYRGATDISFHGVNMSHESELHDQRPGLLFLLGYAQAKGINIIIPEQCPLRQGIDFKTN